MKQKEILLKGHSQIFVFILLRMQNGLSLSFKNEKLDVNQLVIGNNFTLDARLCLFGRITGNADYGEY